MHERKMGKERGLKVTEFHYLGSTIRNKKELGQEANCTLQNINISPSVLSSFKFKMLVQCNKTQLTYK